MTHNMAGVEAEIERHHASMVRKLKELAVQVLDAGDPDDLNRVRANFVDYVDEELLPHAAAEELTLYNRGAQEPSLTILVASMIREHEILRDLRNAVHQATSLTQIRQGTGALVGVFETHAAKENEFLVPALIAVGVDVGALLGTMRHELAGR